jgi:hypothetical protein
MYNCIEFSKTGIDPKCASHTKWDKAYQVYNGIVVPWYVSFVVYMIVGVPLL